MNTNVSFAVFKRNFVSYFSSPTGYLFICVFVLLSASIAFWPDEFFNANLANLGQLNKFFPLIMLVFVPAITMSIWAEERRQGTDELLLTIPAADLDIVLGKYLAAVAIYSVSLGFSLICNFTVLRMLGNPDGGLFIGTYFGYWLVGLAMLAIGMVASFLTANVTVAYILGALFNFVVVIMAVPAVVSAVVRAVISIPAKLVAWTDTVLGWMHLSWAGLQSLRDQLADAALNVPHGVAEQVQAWGIGGQFGDFGRGVVSLSGIVFFLAVVAVMLYLSMVLIGRRHWRSGQFTGSAVAFYSLLHVLTILAFVLLWFVFHRLLVVRYEFVSAATLALVLVGAYLGVHAAIMFLGSTAMPRVAVLPGHYIVRTLALGAVGAGLVLALRYHDLRLDVTREGLNSLAPETVELVKGLKLERPVQIEAFISPESEVPESYLQTRMNLLTRLREMAAYGGEKIVLHVNDTSRFSDVAARAEQRYGIQSKEVRSSDRGTLRSENIYLGVAFNCGLEKVVIPFIDRGIPIEYELVRSIATVTGQKRLKLGVVDTDANLYGNFMSGSPNWPIIEELEKQYEVKRVDLTQALDEKFDVLLAVQPSTLGPEQMENFVAAVRSGVPTAIFEDPCPRFAPWVPATSMPRNPPGGMNQMMAMMRPQQMPKGNIGDLWGLLGVDFYPDQVVWQEYNPYPKIDLFREQKQFVFVDRSLRAQEPFNDQNDISSKLQNVLFPYPGSVSKVRSSDLEFVDLVRTGTKTGTVRYRDMFVSTPFGQQRMNPNARLRPTKESYVLAAQVRGKLKPDQPMAEEKDAAPGFGLGEPAAGEPGQTKPAAKPAGKPKPGEVNVVVVADIDMLTPTFFALREQGAIEELGINFDFDNVTFVLNVLDDLAGEKRFIEIRKRRPVHRTLTRIEDATQQARDETAKARDEAYKEAEKLIQTEQAALDKKVKELEARKDISELEKGIQMLMLERDGNQRVETKKEEADRERDAKIKQIETRLARTIRQEQDTYKMWAVLLPPIPPLIVAVAVFLTRRAREREGVARSRLK